MTSRHATRAFGGILAAGIVITAGIGACGDAGADGGAGDDDTRIRVEREMDRAVARIQQVADSLDDQLQPLPLMRPAEEAALRRHLNDAQLARARTLGVRPDGPQTLDSLVAAGTLVTLEDSTGHWVIRELEHSVPVVTPDVRVLLTRLGERFQARLDSLGLPPYRLEVTSVLRTAESQADLRSSNPNAAGGRSTHEYATTVDVAYSGYAAPVEPAVRLDLPEARWLTERMEHMADGALELVAARRSRELQAVLGRVLREMQDEGQVMVTLERQQPVFHMTVARPLAEEDA